MKACKLFRGLHASATEIFNNAKNNIIPKVLKKYPDVNVIYEGQSESASDTINSMQRWLPVILLLVFFYYCTYL